jgi:crotonobetainyl-CoA:carnitine CoA-transferase CaiB-like acyl-CoA transferase
MVTLNLAAMGADVIKIESHTHFDWWRGSRPPGDNDNLGLHERSHVFNTVNRGKRGITLDLSTTRGREIAIELVATADVVLENYAAGVIEKLGLTYEVLSARNPSLIMIRQPGFGADGPESGYVVFGNTIEGMSGLSSLVGYKDGPPSMLSNALGDPISGLGGTVALLAALQARRKDGKGRLIECAQLEGFLPMVSEALIEFQVSGQVPRRRANMRPGDTPSGAYTTGDDRWLVLEVQDDTQWAALADEIEEAWALEPELSLASGREAHRAVVEANIAAWVLATGEEAVLAACERAGVPAAAIIPEGETLGLEPLLVSNFWQGVEREPVGFHLYPGLAYSMAGERPIPGIPAPLLGQHTEEVLSAMGLDAWELDELSAQGITGKLPVPA